MSIEELKSKTKLSTLSTDELAKCCNERDKLIKEMEDLEFKAKGDDYLLLKWGTLKSTDFSGNKECEKLLDRYGKLGRSMSGVMTQKDMQEQKNIICEIIDNMEGVIKEDWGGRYLTKKEAKEYVLNYK